MLRGIHRTGQALLVWRRSSETQKGFSKVSSREDGECVGCVVLQRIKCGVWGERCGVCGDQRQSHHTRKEEKARQSPAPSLTVANALNWTLTTLISVTVCVCYHNEK